MPDFDLDIRGIQEAQNANVKHMAALKPAGTFGRLIRDVTAFLHHFMVPITHRETGALAASERMEMQNLEGRLFLDPMATNPLSGEHTAVYGPFENARGGDHAFFDRTVAQAPAAVGAGIHTFLNRF